MGLNLTSNGADPNSVVVQIDFTNAFGWSAIFAAGELPMVNASCP